VSFSAKIYNKNREVMSEHASSTQFSHMM